MTLLSTRRLVDKPLVPERAAAPGPIGHPGGRDTPVSTGEPGGHERRADCRFTVQPEVGGAEARRGPGAAPCDACRARGSAGPAQQAALDTGGAARRRRAAPARAGGLLR